jgi:hypothetical protein
MSMTTVPTRPVGELAGSGPRGWLTELLLGARLSLAGGRTAWLRTAMTGLGVGLGVALLLVAAAAPAILADRDHRRDARTWISNASAARTDATALIRAYETRTHGQIIDGAVVAADGAHPPVPPGLAALPGPGQMAVSPALARLLDSPRGALLAERLPYQRVAEIGRAGLAGPNELYVYLGASRGALPEPNPAGETARIDHFGTPPASLPVPQALAVLIVVIAVALLMPIGAFTATAVRFGSDARDRQLAAVRLVGADPWMARRIATGGALAGAFAGLLAGAALFAAARPLAEHVIPFSTGVYAGDIRPSPVLAVVAVAAVPLAAVAITLFSLRRVVIEPLGVVRRGRPARRRVAWRVLLPLLGLALLWPVHATGTSALSGTTTAQLATGVVLVLAGVAVLLPWVVEAALRRLGGGPPAWQLAVRRLQLDNATTVRAVAAISVAVSGAIALQMVFTAAEHRFTTRADTAIPTGAEPGTTRLLIQTDTPGSTAARLGQRLAGVTGPSVVWSFASGTVSGAEGDADSRPSGGLAVAGCATLRRLATLPSCADGDVFLAAEAVAGPRGAMPGAPPLSTDPTAAGWLPAPGGVLPSPGTRVTLGTPAAESLGAWTIPPGARTVPARPESPGYTAVLATPGALPAGVLDALTVTAYADLPDDLPDGLDRVQNAVAAVDPFATVYGRDADLVLPLFGQVRMVMYVGIVAVLALIGASLLVGIVEQLRERRRVLAVLVAFGARGRTLAASVLWQTAVPMALGVTVAVGVGMGLGSALLRLVGLPTSFDWANITTVAATAVGAVLVTTAASLPVLRRLMRPDGLRGE